MRPRPSASAWLAGCLPLAALLVAMPAAAGQVFASPSESLERLLQAARRGDLPAIHQALAAGAPVDGGDPKWGETALIRAALFGQREAVRALLAAGATATAVSAGQRTALHAAAEGGHAEIVEDLLQAGIPVDAGADIGETPLFAALEARQPAAVPALLAAGARHDAMKTTLSALIGSTLANERGDEHMPLIRAFIRAKAGIDTPDIGVPPILKVLAYCHQPYADEVARLLIEAGANLQVKTAQGLTASEEARRRLAGEPACKATVAVFERPGGRR